MDAGRKAGEAFKKAVSSDEAVTAEIEIKKKDTVRKPQNKTIYWKSRDKSERFCNT